MKLLVVDDQSPVCAIISRLAIQGGWEAICSTTSEKLAELIVNERVDVLILDYFLQAPVARHNGIQVLENLRAQGITIPVILFTGHPDSIDREAATRLGVLNILEKPLSIQDLRINLDEARRLVLEKVSSAHS